MEDIYTVYKGVLFEDSIRNAIGKENVSVCRLLHFLNIDDIAQHVENNHYSNKDWHFKYRISSMIKLTIVKCFRNLSFNKTISSLSDEEALLLHFVNDDGDISLPTGSTLHHFVKYRLGTEGLQHIMGMIAERIIGLTKARDLKTDSTPLEASRYDKHSDYNPHYGCKMDKAHITLIGVFPLYMTYTNGLAHDSPELRQHIEFLTKLNLEADSYALDGAYDSFNNYADIWNYLNINPTISLPSDAVISAEGRNERINHWINKMWKSGGDPHFPLNRKLKFLYKNGREKPVGMYLRNKNMEDTEFQKKKDARQDCERFHKHIKHLLKFDVRSIRMKSRELYVTVNLVAYQLILLTNLQNNIKNPNSFANYV
jgi:uncharacterized protein Usg